jgi:predicted nucleotide-binding protein
MKNTATKMLRLRELQEEIDQLDSEDFPERDLFYRQTALLIRELFGQNSQYLDDWKKITIPQMDYDDKDAYFRYSQEWDTAKTKMINICKVMIQDINTSYTEKNVKTEEPKEKKTKSKRVFVVHGTDHASLKEMKTLLQEIGLNPIILYEQPSGGMTLIEKLEKYSNVGFAFIILTPDDFGGPAGELERTMSTPQPAFDTVMSTRRILAKNFRKRARQNVVLEFGYFVGKLGRGNVCCLYKGSIELPSDVNGICYVPFENSINEIRKTILQELEAIGYEIKS